MNIMNIINFLNISNIIKKGQDNLYHYPDFLVDKFMGIKIKSVLVKL